MLILRLFIYSKKVNGDSMDNKIGKNIQKYRKERGLTQKDLAKKLQISNSSVSNWEQGINTPPIDRIIDICNALSISINELFDVNATSVKLSEEELRVIKAYRYYTELQYAVKKLLGINTEK